MNVLWGWCSLTPKSNLSRGWEFGIIDICNLYLIIDDDITKYQV
jgi:hypothetical protein